MVIPHRRECGQAEYPFVKGGRQFLTTTSVLVGVTGQWLMETSKTRKDARKAAQAETETSPDARALGQPSADKRCS